MVGIIGVMPLAYVRRTMGAHGVLWRAIAVPRLCIRGEVQGGGGTLSSSLTEHANGSEPSKL